MIKNKTNNKETVDALISRGLERVFVSHYNLDDLTIKMRKMILFHPEILIGYFKAIDNHSALNEVFKSANEFEIDLSKIPFWKKKINAIANLATSSDESISGLWYGQADYIISAANMVQDFDWKKLFDNMSKLQDNNNYLRTSYKTVAKRYSETNPVLFKSHVENNIFFTKERRPAYPVRGIMYSHYVGLGFLTKKTARKIRSDGSEDSSLSGLKALTDNLDLYSNSDELLLQFTDSKYEGVISHLADTLPEYLLASIMGTPFYWAKRKLESRLESIEKAREAAKSLSNETESEVYNG